MLLAAVLAAGCRGKFVRPVNDAAVERTPARVQRGSYLVNQVTLCPVCHTTRAGDNMFLDGERADAFLGGGNVYADKGLGTVWVPNLTPDPDTGLGRWKDDEILRAMRDGVSADGRFLNPLMPFHSYQHLADEDARAIVAYLRTIPAYRQPRPRRRARASERPRRGRAPSA